MVRPEVSPFGPAAICNSFDLSCCCVALQVESDMTSKFRYYHGSKDNLDKGTMCLLPSSFGCEYHSSVNLQMTRVLKYINRGFKPMNEIRSNEWLSLFRLLFISCTMKEVIIMWSLPSNCCAAQFLQVSIKTDCQSSNNTLNRHCCSCCCQMCIND